MSHFADRYVSRHIRLRLLLPLLALAVVTIVLVPAGAAKPQPVTAFTICVQNASSSPSCTGTANSTFTGNSASTIQLSVTNSSSSTTQLASANITVPEQLKVVQGSALPSKYVTTSGQHILFQGINLPAGKSFVATFTADVACGGTFDWSIGQLAYASSDLSGTSFSYSATRTTTTTIDTACHLAFVTQPTDTQSGTAITDRATPVSHPVTVGLFAGATGTATPLTSCPVGYATCSVTLDRTPADGVIANAGSHQFASGLASYPGLSITISALTEQFRLTAAAAEGPFAPTVQSGSFLIGQTVSALDCTTGNSCTSNGQKPLQGAGLTDSYVEIAGSGAFSFMTLSPYTVTGAVPDGCTGRPDLGVAGFAESDARGAGSGTLTIKYFVDMDHIKANYGANTGQQFIPICVGARPVDSSGVIHDCTESGWDNVGWLGDGINPNTGKFTGKPATAVCNPDGYYWGIISSYQDKLDATTNPVVTSWNGQNISGKNYREFDMSVPSGWDYRGGP